MKHHVCNIIPNYILRKTSDPVNQIVKSYMMRSKRKRLNKNPALRKIPKATHKEIRRLFDSRNEEIITEQPIATDEQIHSVEESQHFPLELANKCYDFFHNDFALESYNNKNAPVDVHINFGSNYNNAFWDGEIMVFGNGDGEYFNPFLTQNIFTHEFTHAITDYQVGLIYESESGALNEHLSDVFAVCLDQKIRNQDPSSASWLIGDDLFTSKVKGNALRTFKDELAYNDPNGIGIDEQPKHMNNYQVLSVTEDQDWGGVHINSGIPNHAFYQFCNITNKKSWTSPAQIWFQTYRRIKAETTFNEFAKVTISITKSVYPDLVKDLQQAWSNVGL